ncbi:MAG: IPTL-CTERM sorting domain-containing protein [Hyphomicrobiales bacterium]|nr:MAG: IPTL-CTERM sorting domain-containing protein [Hyphomicrobiales bacterium]
MLTVKIDFPAGSLNGLQPRKYGPSAANAASTCFALGPITGNSVSYTVQDNGVGDNDPVAGQIEDPSALVLAAAVPGPGGVASIPTLSEWGVILLSPMAAGLGLGMMRRRS